MAKGKRILLSTIGSPSLDRASNRPVKPTFATLLTRMSPSAMVEFFNSGLSDQQVTAIRSMGFGGLMCIKVQKIPGHLAYWLVENFDPFTSSVTAVSLPVRDVDVHNATGLPMGDKVIDYASKFDKDEEFIASADEWKLQYGCDKVTVNQIFEKMVEQRDGGDDFKRNFIVFIVSELLAGVKGEVPSLRILKSIKDISDIPNLGWCDFVMKNIISSVEQWRIEHQKELQGEPKKTFKGPILVLIFIYLDRVVFRSREVPRVFPTLCTWTQARVASRVSQEKRLAKKFGDGFVDGMLPDKRNACRCSGFREAAELAGNRVKADVVQPGSGLDGNRDKRTRAHTCIGNMASSGKVLASAFVSFVDSVSDGKDVFSDSDAVCQLTAFADAMREGFRLALPRKLGGARGEGCAGADGPVLMDGQSGSSGGSTGGCELVKTGGPDNDPCWSDPDFVDAVFALCNAFGKPSSDAPSPKKHCPSRVPTSVDSVLLDDGECPKTTLQRPSHYPTLLMLLEACSLLNPAVPVPDNLVKLKDTFLMHRTK